MDVSGAFLELVVGRVSPRLRARAAWRLEGHGADFAPRVAEHLVRPGDVVLDVGASWGLYTSALSRLVGPSGHVHAFEPGPANLRSLRAIAGDNVTVHAVALSDSEGQADLNIPVLSTRPTHAMASLETPSAKAGVEHRSVRVPLRRLDGIDALRDAPVSFIKCDVEGHEAAVLDGADALLTRTLPAILVEIEQRHQERDIRELLASLTARGYAGYCLHANGLRPLGEFDVERDQLAHLDPDKVQPHPGEGYVNNFCFVDPSRDVSALLA